MAEAAAKGHLCFGTIDSWLISRLTGGAVHATDVSNASRTMVYNIHEQRWDPELLKLFGIAEDSLPRVLPSAGEFGKTSGNWLFPAGIPIAGVAGDQQAALFGHGCLSVGATKSTGLVRNLSLMNTGEMAATNTQDC